MSECPRCGSASLHPLPHPVRLCTECYLIECGDPVTTACDLIATLRAENERHNKVCEWVMADISDSEQVWDAECCPRVQCQGTVKRLRAEIAAMKPVVDAANKWNDWKLTSGFSDVCDSLRFAVDTYREAST